MAFADLLTVPVTVITPGTVTDTNNDDLDEWATATTRDTLGWPYQTDMQEVVGNRDATVTSTQLFLAATDPINSNDRVTIDGTTYEVIGQPRRARTPRGVHHVEVNLTAVTG